MRNNIWQAACSIALLASLCKILGFCRELLLAKYFGTGQIVDIYLMSVAIPSILFGFLPSIGIGITAVYFQIEQNMRNRLVTTAMLSSIGIAIICVMFTYWQEDNIVQLVAWGFSENAKRRTLSFLKVTILSIVFVTPIQILTSFLNCEKKYVQTNSSNIIISLGQIICIIIAAYFDSNFLPYSFVLPLFVQFIILFYFAISSNFRLDIHYGINKYFKKICDLVFPIFVSSLLVDLNGFVDKYLASGLQDGCIAALNYAFILQTVCFTICSTIISTLFYPRIAELFASDNHIKLIQEIHFVCNWLIILCAPISIVSIIYSGEIIEIVYMRGSFTIDSLSLTQIPFAVYSISLVWVVVRDLLIKILYACGDTKSNSLYSVLTILLNIILSILFINPFGHIGIALGTTLSTMLTLPFYAHKLSYVIEGYSVKNNMCTINKILIASCLIGLCGLSLKYFLLTSITHEMHTIASKIVVLFVQFSVLFLIYVCILRFFKLSELDIFLKYKKKSF